MPTPLSVSQYVHVASNITEPSRRFVTRAKARMSRSSASYVVACFAA
jgi:hypothetical protein